MLGTARHVHDLAILETNLTRNAEQIVGAVGDCRLRLLHGLDPRVSDRMLECVPRAVGRGRVVEIEM